MYYERQFNLLYILEHQHKSGSGTENRGFWGQISGKSSMATYDGSADNILVYDIPKEKSLWLFNDNDLRKNERVHHLFFELYMQADGTMVFEGNAPHTVVNNYGLEGRPLNDKILVQTGDGDKNRIWVSDKWGFEKKMVAEYSKDGFWQIDLYNSAIRIFDRDEKKNLLIRNFDW